MGRWGFCLFEGDQDCDLVHEISYDFFKDETTSKEEKTMDQKMSDESGEDAYDYQKTLLSDDIDELRAKFGCGRGDKLFAQYRTQEGEDQGQYRVILLGALMMRVGAKIQPRDFQYLRDLIPQINCNEGYALPLWDHGFRRPGKRQFLAALDQYKAGVPRNFGAPSCYHCGKIKDDTGKTPLQCSRCKHASYCNKDCQKAHWSIHKPRCSNTDKRIFLNV